MPFYAFSAAILGFIEKNSCRSRFSGIEDFFHYNIDKTDFSGILII